MFLIDDFLIGLAIAAAGAAVSAGANAIGSENARAAQESAADKATKLQREIFNQQQENYQQQRRDAYPWLDVGATSLRDLRRQMESGSFDTKLDPSQIANDPGYQFRMQQGQQALERSASARGMLNSGGALKSLARYSQGVASDEYQNAWNRNNADNTGRFNRLASLAGVGQTASQNLGALGAQNSAQMGQFANNMSSLYGAVGNAQAAGAIGMANAFSGGMQSMGNMAMQYGMGGYLGGGQQQIPQQPYAPGSSMTIGGPLR